MSRQERIVIIGAGIGGLTAAIKLAQLGFHVDIIESRTAPGGKMRAVHIDNAAIDAGPTVLTMKWVFDELLRPSRCQLEDIVELEHADLLARHFWQDGSQLDLHRDIEASASAIEQFAGPADADGYRRFCRDSEKIFEMVRLPLICAQRPGLIGFSMAVLRRSPSTALQLNPFASLWNALGNYFPDPRLQQLFARYATYVGSSPFRTPATLMLIAHVEQAGVWLVRQGMHGLAAGLAEFAEQLGVGFTYGQAATDISAGQIRRHCVELEDGTRMEADAVIFNGDVSALDTILHGPAHTKPDKVGEADRSLSAMTWCTRMDMGEADLAHHNVFFSNDYRTEFDLLHKGHVPEDDPTVYVCAQDRTDKGNLGRKDGAERLFMLVNAPADGDRQIRTPDEVEQCREKLTRRLKTNGINLRWQESQTRFTGPAEFARLFPTTGGALYGRASHGWLATFRRPGARTKIQGLYLAGGSVHPGPGVPMAAMSGRLAATSLAADFGLTSR